MNVPQRTEIEDVMDTGRVAPWIQHSGQDSWRRWPLYWDQNDKEDSIEDQREEIAVKETRQDLQCKWALRVQRAEKRPVWLEQDSEWGGITQDDVIGVGRSQMTQGFVSQG